MSINVNVDAAKATSAAAPLRTSRSLSDMRIAYQKSKAISTALYEYNHSADLFARAPTAGNPFDDKEIVEAAGILYSFTHEDVPPSLPALARVPKPKRQTVHRAQRTLSKRALRGNKPKPKSKSSDAETEAEGEVRASPIPKPRRADRVQASLATAARARSPSPPSPAMIHGPSKLRQSSTPTPDEVDEDKHDIEAMEANVIQFLANSLMSAMDRTASLESATTDFTVRTPSPPPQTQTQRIVCPSASIKEAPSAATPPRRSQRHTKRTAETAGPHSDTMPTSPTKKLSIRLRVSPPP